MKIQIKHNGKTYYIVGKKKREQPQITPYINKAHDYKSLNLCKNVRDDVLEYFKGAMICG